MEEEPYDRGAIEPRSSRDRGAIETAILKRSLRIRFVAILWHSWECMEHDRRRSKPDCGGNRGQSWRKSWLSWELIRRLMRAELWWLWSHDAAPRDSLPRRRQPTSTTAFIALKIGPNSLFKSMYFPLLFFNFWLIREGIKRISRKILSSSWFPRV